MVRREKLPIKWDKLAKSNLDTICTYIEQDSVTAARKVKKALVELAGSLNDFPEKYAAEPYLENELENYRSVSKWSCKIIFEVTDQEIIIADIFHTSQNPKKIKKR